MLFRHILLSLLVLSASPIAQANIALLGTFSYDTFVPAGSGSPGVDAFNLSNLTGAFDLPPDFPVSDSLTFLGGAVTLTDPDLTQQVFTVGDLAPGFLLDGSGNPLIQVSSNQLFISAEFTATLSPTSFMLYDGSTFTPDTVSVDVLLLPSSGPDLIADSDQTTLAAVQNSGSPEPASFLLAAAALTGLALRWRLTRRRIGSK